MSSNSHLNKQIGSGEMENAQVAQPNAQSNKVFEAIVCCGVKQTTTLVQRHSLAVIADIVETDLASL